MRGGIWSVTIDNNPAIPGSPNNVSLRFATPGFFTTMGIPLLRGRSFDTRDRGATPGAAVGGGAVGGVLLKTCWITAC